MNRFGLALSGGGFRATLYHLGLVRFLRDAEILQSLTHITSVSGGSILAAHLVLNWDRYSGSDEEFEAAAAEILDFVGLDIRNRILRRYPLLLPAQLVRRVLWLGSNRRLTRTGLLEAYYERHLYGDKCLFELPQHPQLHILSTNLSEGRLCSFTRDGLMVQRHLPAHEFRFDRVHTGLATVAMAVTASSAFPGFFPPLELTGTDVGANEGEFSRQSFTDGGIFDNLGVRMFRLMERIGIEQGASDGPFDAVLVSDAGKKFKTLAGAGAGGIIGTALRASDILMDRVWQLEHDTFDDASDFVFAPITAVVGLSEDPTALHPEMQRQVTNTRTDLDRFSDLEISSLVAHGYCVGRQACASRPDLFGADLPRAAPWNPLRPGREGPGGHDRTSQAVDPKDSSRVTTQARMLQGSARRRLGSRLLDFGDWTTYLHLALFVPFVVVVPYLAFKYHKQSSLLERLTNAIAQAGQGYPKVMELFERGPVEPWSDSLAARQVRELGTPDYSEFEVLSDTWIVDLRPWRSGSPDRRSYTYRLVVLRKEMDHAGNNLLRFHFTSETPKIDFRCRSRELHPVLTLLEPSGTNGNELVWKWELLLDVSKVAIGDDVVVEIEQICREGFQSRTDDEPWVGFNVETEVGRTGIWTILPAGRPYETYRVIRYAAQNPDVVEPSRPHQVLKSSDSSIIAVGFAKPKPGYTYECHWRWRDGGGDR